MEIKIRPINIKDYKDIYLLNQDLGYVYPIEKIKERINYIIENTKDIILIAEKSKEILGYIHGRSYELLYCDPLIDILGFVVKKNFRNNGVGTLLISELEILVKNKGYKGIRLVSGDDRENAHKFYIKHGYNNKKDQKNFIKIFY